MIKAEPKQDGSRDKIISGETAPPLPDDEAESDTYDGPEQAAPMDDNGLCKLPAGTPWKAGQHLAPTYTVTEKEGPRSNTNSAVTDAEVPTYTGGVAVDSAACLWRYQLKSVDDKGTITFIFYTEDHYPAPTPNDDSGALTNVNKENWNEIVTDLGAYKRRVAGNWSAYRRTILHERYHWATEWQGAVNTELVNAENNIEKLSLGLAAAPTAKKAEKKLAPKAQKIFNDAMTAVVTAYNALGDSPGDPPYIASSAGAVDLIERIKAYAAEQGW